jgi:signal transduction histidine kinase
LAKEPILNLDVQTIFWMDAFLYLMLHAAIWYGLARFRSPVVALWSVSGILSAFSLCVLGSRGLLSTDVVVVVGQLLMVVGNWGRQIALRSLDGPPDRAWLWRMGLFNGAYLCLSYGLQFTGSPETTIMLVFYIFYTVNCLEYVVSSRRIALTHDTFGVKAVKWAGILLSGSLGIKALATLAGVAATDLYELSWDQGVVFAGQFFAIVMLSVGFMQIFVDKNHRAQIAVQQQLAREQERSALALQHSKDLSGLLKEREEIIRQLTLSNKSAGMGALVASFAHELNQPLAATLLHAELIQGQMKWVVEEGRALDSQLLTTVASHIVSDTQRAGEIIRKLRNLFRMGKGEYAKLDFKRLVLDVLDIVQAKATHEKVKIVASFDEDFCLSGDVTQLHQVLLNVVTNAIETLCEIGHRERVLQVRGLTLPGFLELEIEDNGTGIELHKQAEVFSLFKSTKSEGMGVGLWLSQAIVESHGGTLRFVSEPGQGTVFTLRLPSGDYVLPASSTIAA